MFGVCQQWHVDTVEVPPAHWHASQSLRRGWVVVNPRSAVVRQSGWMPPAASDGLPHTFDITQRLAQRAAEHVAHLADRFSQTNRVGSLGPASASLFTWFICQVAIAHTFALFHCTPAAANVTRMTIGRALHLK